MVGGKNAKMTPGGHMPKMPSGSSYGINSTGNKMGLGKHMNTVTNIAKVQTNRNQMNALKRHNALKHKIKVNNAQDAYEGIDELNVVNEESCGTSLYGCCPDNITVSNADGSNCSTSFSIGGCAGTQYGCCPDNVTASNADGSNCSLPVPPVSIGGCAGTQYGWLRIIAIWMLSR
jgi:hypothetical protein